MYLDNWSALNGAMDEERPEGPCSPMGAQTETDRSEAVNNNKGFK